MFSRVSGHGRGRTGTGALRAPSSCTMRFEIRHPVLQPVHVGEQSMDVRHETQSRLLKGESGHFGLL